MNKIKLALAIFLLTLSIIVYGQSDNNLIKRSHGGISIENNNYLIDWDMEVTGYSPYSGKFILEGSRLKSKNIDKTVDVAIISPVELESGSKAYVW